MKKQLLAPNGKPSNLTPEQYKLVRTPAFKKWFGDWENDPENASKVVDENGEPLILFHGTDVNFSVFDLSKIGEGSDLLGKGIYLTENKDVANFYANYVSKKRYIIRYEEGILGSEVPIYEKDADKKAEKHKVIYEFFVKAKKNININEVEVDENIKQIIIKSIIELFDDNSEKYVEDAIKYAHNNNEKISNYRGVILYLIYRFPDTKEEIIKYIKNKYDCIIFEPTTEFESNLRDFNYKNYVVFNANQIKLADGSNTTFDANNDDIRFNNGGSVNDKYQYVVDEIKKAIIDLGLPYLNEVDEFNRYYLSKSKNDFGQSWYMIFEQESRPLEIRISDHTVTSSSRIMDEKYIAMLDISNPFKYQTPKSIAKSLDLKFKRLKNIAEKRNKLFDEEREKRDYMNNKLQPFLDKLKLENKSIGKNDRTYQTLEEIIIKHPDWEYIYHYPNNGAFSFYFVKNDKSGSLSPYFINEKYFDFLNDNGYLDNFKRGGRTIAQTPAPKKERIYGSNINKQKSSESNTSAKQIVFDEKTLKSIKNKVDKHNEENPDNKITLSSAKAVVRRGMGAYSKSHRPTIKGGKPNSRVAWGLARLNAFIYKIKNGVSKSGKYIQDDDLINELNIKYNIGGEISKQSINNVKNDKINYLNVLNSVWSFFGIKLD